MALASVMASKDTVAGSQATVYLDIDGQRIKAGNLIKYEVTFTKNKVEVPILGRNGKGSKATGFTIAGNATMHYNVSLFRKMALKYQNTGEDTYFDIQATNEDPTSAVGRQTCIFYGCNLDEIILGKADATADYLDEEISFTVESFDMPEEFKKVIGITL